MTWITPRPGRRAPLRRRLRLGVAGVAVLAGLLAGFLAPLPGLPAAPAAAAEEGEPGDGSETGVAPVVLTLAVGEHGRVLPGTGATATVTVANDGDAGLDPGSVRIEVNRTPLTTAEELAAWLDDGSVRGAFADLGAAAHAAIPSGESVRTRVVLPADELALTTPGIYPLRGIRIDPDPTAASPMTRTVLLVTAGNHPELAVVVPVTATPDSGALLTAEELTALTAPAGALTVLLDGVTGTRAALAVDPAILAAIRALGSSAPPSADAWLRRLEALPNERFLLRFADADATAQARARLPELLAPLGLSSALDPADFATDPTPAPPASPTPAPTTPAGEGEGEAELPSLAELTALRQADRDLLWPRGDASADDLAAFAGYLGDGTGTILPAARAPEATAAHATVGGHDVLLAESEASALLSRATTTVDADTREGLLAGALAHLLLAAERRDGPLLVALDRTDAPSDALDAVLDALADTGPVTTLAALRETPAAPAELVAPAEETGLPTADERAGALLALLEDEAHLHDFSSILQEPALLTDPERLRILGLLAVGADPHGFDDAVAAHRTATSDTLGSVTVQPPSRVQLISSESDLPVWVRNGLPWPIAVTLEARPSDGRLEVQRYTAVEAQSASNTRVRVPVEARVGSGEVTVRFALTSPTGVPIGSPGVANVTVRADWETIGISVFGGLIALLLVLGVFRTLLRRRQERAAGADPGAAAAADPAEEDR